MSDSHEVPKPSNPPEMPKPAQFTGDQPEASAQERGTSSSNTPNSNSTHDVSKQPPDSSTDSSPKEPDAPVSDASKPTQTSDVSKSQQSATDQTLGSKERASSEQPKATRLPEVPKQTQLLGDQSDTGPMEQREPRPGTTQLGPGWRLRFKINDQTTAIDLENKVVVGRVIDDEQGVDFDLTPFGAYHYGVSRQHAILSMHDGFLYLEDNGSTNGTRINGFQMTPHQKYRLRDGDEIEFARLRTSIRFERPGGK